MKKLLLFIACGGYMFCYSQNKPILGKAPDETLIVNSGDNQIIIPQISDGDNGIVQHITLSAVSSSPSLLEVKSITFNDSSTLAVINVTEKGTIGTVSLYITATDPDGSTSDTIQVDIKPYSKPGIHFQMHDVVFWQEFVPLNNTPVFDTIIQSGMAPYASINWDKITFSVSAGCTQSPPCIGDDFFTALFIGYLVPPVTGDYYFTIKTQDDGAIWISDNEDYSKAKAVVYRGDKQTEVGTEMGDMERRSAAVPLQAGKVYAFYATQWIVHTRTGGVLWEGPGISKQYIPGANMLYVYDPVKPTAPSNLRVLSRGVTDLRIGWHPATDNKKVVGYNIYFDGVKLNPKPYNDTIYRITGLLPSSSHSVVVAAVDAMGNLSPVSNLVHTTTYPTDGNPPSPPTSVQVTTLSDMAVKISWSGAADGETCVKGYQVFVDGMLYNATELIYETSAIISGLSPETSYAITIKAVDAGDNASAASNPLNVKTLPFDPGHPSLGVKKARLTILPENIGWNEGMGIMPDYESGKMISDPVQKARIEALKPSALIWGGINVNSYSLSSYQGTGKPMTFAKFLDFCNKTGAYCIITTGIGNSTDWMQDSTTFDKFMEYLNGPSSSPQGAIRASEGFSAPLLQASKGLVILLGCEVWGGTAHGAEIGANYDNYAAWARRMAMRIKKSPYYDKNKVFVGISGRNPDWTTSLGLNDKLLKGDTGQIDWLTLSGYMGGNMNYDPAIDPGESELDYYKNGFEYMMKNINGLKTHMSYMFLYCERLKTMNFYESNMTTPAYNGRLGQAITITDYHATAQETGLALPCVFHLTGGEWRITEPENSYRPLPLYLTAQYYNTHCKGHILKTILVTNEKIKNSSGKELAWAPVGCHAYTDSGRFAIALFSRDFENDYQIQIDLPDTLTVNATGKKYIISGSDYSTKDAVIDSSTIAFADSLVVTIPKHSMVLICFNGSPLPFKKLPLGYYKYKKIESIKIVPKNGKTTIDKKYDYVDLTAQITPADAMEGFLFKYKWEVVENSSKALTSVMESDYQVRDLGKAPVGSTTTIRVSSYDDPNIKDEIVIRFPYSALETTNEGNISLYPNPVNDELTIISQDDDVIHVGLCDVTGRQMTECKAGGNTATVNLHGLPAGIYLARIEGNHTGITLKKIIKQ